MHEALRDFIMPVYKARACWFSVGVFFLFFILMVFLLGCLTSLCLFTRPA